MILKPFMRTALLLIITFCLVWSCENSNKNSDELSLENPISKKDKFLVEAGRDVERIDSSIVVNNDDLQMIKFRIFPSFLQAHSIYYSTADRKLSFFQTTQKLSITDDYYKIPEEEREHHLYLFMKKHSSKNFHAEITEKEEQLILKEWKAFNKAGYKAKILEGIDGAEFYTSIYEKDTIVLVNTISPSSHHTKLLAVLLDLSKKYAKDSITQVNIEHLKGYL